MRSYKKILVWENDRRIDRLVEFRNLVVEYFNNSRAESFSDTRIENDTAREVRPKINRIIDEVYDIVLSSGVNPRVTWTPPPAIGGYIRSIDLVHNIFNLHRFQIGPNELFDCLERSIGIYERNHRASVIRTCNPFFYIGLLFEKISELPFIALGKLGLNRSRAESSLAGRLVKGILYLITVIAAFLTVLELLGFLEPVKSFVHELVGSNKAMESDA